MEIRSAMGRTRSRMDRMLIENGWKLDRQWVELDRKWVELDREWLDSDREWVEFDREWGGGGGGTCIFSEAPFLGSSRTISNPNKQLHRQILTSAQMRCCAVPACVTLNSIYPTQESTAPGHTGSRLLPASSPGKLFATVDR